MFPMKTAQKFAANFISNAASDRHFYFQLTLNCACRGDVEAKPAQRTQRSLDADQAQHPSIPDWKCGVEWVELSLMLASRASAASIAFFQKLWKEGYFLLCSQSTRSLASI